MARLTDKQAAALAYLREHPNATPDALCRAAKVSTYGHNREAFIVRLIENHPDLIRLTLTKKGQQP